MRLDRKFPFQFPSSVYPLCIVVRELTRSLSIFGGHKAVVRPDPIPNSAVKRSIANGSACIACARVGRRQIFPYQARYHP